jgi:hypothetical protein
VLHGVVSQRVRKLLPLASPKAKLPEEERFARSLRMIIVE